MAQPNMPKEMRKKLYPKMLKKWPEICSNCQKSIEELNLKPFNGETGGLQLHHTSYQFRLDDIEYIRFMCHGCNHKQEFSKQTIIEAERELSASHKANIQKHPIFLEWFANAMVENNYHMPRKEIIASGAYISGANVKTVGGWIEPLVSPEGPFSDVDIHGVNTVYLKGKEARMNFPNKTVSDFNKDVEKNSKE